MVLDGSVTQIGPVVAETQPLKISIIIPTYNSVRYLQRCLRSIERQKYPNLEVIIVDGGSTDGTAEIVGSFPNLVSTFISEPDRGQGDAVTKGLLLASGDICHWHASDDIVTPGAFARIASEFDTNQDIDLIFSDGWAFDDRHLYVTGPCRGLTFWDALLFEGRFQSDSAYWRRTITPAGIPLDDSKALSVDEDFFLRIWAGHKEKWLEGQLGAFCIRSGQLSQVLNKNDLAEQRVATRLRVAAAMGLSSNRLRYLRVLKCSHYVSTKCMREFERALRRVVRITTGDIARRRKEHTFFQEWL